MDTHKLKLRIHFCDAVSNGEKNFEIRENDRGFQKGDRIEFLPVDIDGIPCDHVLQTKLFEITYVLSGWGLKEGYVVFGIKELT